MGNSITGDTPLAMAMRFDNVDAVQFLMEQGANPRLVKSDIKALDNDAVRKCKDMTRQKIAASVALLQGEPKQEERPSSPVQDAQASSLIEMQQGRL